MKSYPGRSVCFICYRRFPDTNFENYSHFVSEDGYHVSVVAVKDHGQMSFEILGNKRIYRVSLPKTENIRIKKIVFAAWVVKFIRRNTFAILHMHHTCPYFLLYKVFATNRIKFVYHNTSYPIATNRFKSYKKMIIHFLQALFMDSIIIQCEELKEKLLGFRHLKKTQVVPIGFNPRIFSPIKQEQKVHSRKMLGIQNRVKVLIYVGKITRQRRLHRLIEAFALVCKANQEVMLLMVGPGDDLKKLLALSNKFGINKKVHFVGKVSHLQVINYLYASDIGISYVPITENYNYNPPLKTFEYLACGIPVVATRTVSNSMIVKDQINGVLVNDNVKDFANAIIDLLKDDIRIEHLSRNSQRSIEGQDFYNITKKYLLPLYSRLLEK